MRKTGDVSQKKVIILQDENKLYIFEGMGNLGLVGFISPQNIYTGQQCTSGAVSMETVTWLTKYTS